MIIVIVIVIIDQLESSKGIDDITIVQMHGYGVDEGSRLQ